MRHQLKNGYWFNLDIEKYVHQEVHSRFHGSSPKGYHVHHIDKDRLNNSPENLISIPAEFHDALHDLDRKGIVLRSRREVQAALAFYLRGLDAGKARPLPIASKPKPKKPRPKPRKKPPRMYTRWCRAKL